MRVLQTHNGQALVELAVFGAFFLMLLGVLLSYGLKYNFQQKAHMTAFRRALKIASDQDRGSGSAMIVEDRAIPDPSTMFGIGSTAPITASASVQRDYKMDEQVIDVDSLSGTVMDIQTSRTSNNGATSTGWMPRRVYKTAAFRVENLVPVENIDKYQHIYGSVLVLLRGFAPTDPSEDAWDLPSNAEAAKICSTGYYNITDADGVITALDVCDGVESYDAIKIIDACSGEIADYSTCVAQARKLVDADFCTRECDLNNIPGSEIVCSTVCNLLTNPPNQADTSFDSARGGAWYAADWQLLGNNYNFKYISGWRLIAEAIPATPTSPYVPAVYEYGPALFGPSRTMGLQSNVVQNTVRSESIAKAETAGAISTQETAVWTDTLNRTFLSRVGSVNAEGFETASAPNVVSEDATSEVSGSLSQTR